VPKIISIRDWQTFDYETLNEKVKEKLEHLAEIDLSATEKAAALSDTIETCVVELLNHKVIRVKGNVQRQPWYTLSMEEQRIVRDKAAEAAYFAAKVLEGLVAAGATAAEITAAAAKREALWSTYATERNKYTAMCKKGEFQFYYEKIDGVKGDAKLMWKTLKKFVDVDSVARSATLDITFDDNSNDSVANKLNHFFVDSIKTIVNTIDEANEEEKMLISDIPQAESSFNFRPIEMAELEKIVKNLKPKTVPNNTTLKVVLSAFETIKVFLLDVINSTIKEGCFPPAWKVSMVVPIPKEKNAKTPQNFRPINILPLFEKVLEIVLQKQIVQYLDENSILYELQSGFRENHSCESAIQYILGEWRKAAEEGKVTIAVFLDFKRAFETIDRGMLLKKLEKYGFSDDSRRLLGSFLNDRKQYVCVNEEKSSEINVDIGIAQGSVLGPLLFILYINDLPSHLKNVLVKIFADDTLLAISAYSYKEAAEKMNIILKFVSAWLKIFKVKLNVSKSKFMVIAKSKNKITSFQPEIDLQPIKIESEVISRVEVYKYLGVMIDCLLNFDEHVSYVIKKTGKKIMYLGRIKNKLSMSTKKLIYNCIIAPHFDYCSTVMWKISAENMRKLQVLQNIAMRYILKCNRKTSSSVLLRKTAWLNVKQKIELNALVMVKKIINGEVPKYLSNSVQLVSEFHKYETRGRNNIRVSTVNSAFAEKSLFHSGFIHYNNLPVELKAVQKTRVFKTECIAHLKSESKINYEN
jgi:ribosomal protein S4